MAYPNQPADGAGSKFGNTSLSDNAGANEFRPPEGVNLRTVNGEKVADPTVNITLTSGLGQSVGNTTNPGVNSSQDGTLLSRLRGMHVSVGETTDAAVSTDATGTISARLRGLVVLIVNLLTRWPASLGEKTRALSFPVVLPTDIEATATLHNLANATANGTVITVINYDTLLLEVRAGTGVWSITPKIQRGIDAAPTRYKAVAAYNVETGARTTAITAAGIYRINVAGAREFIADYTYTSGTPNTTVYAQAIRGGAPADEVVDRLDDLNTQLTTLQKTPTAVTETTVAFGDLADMIHDHTISTSLVSGFSSNTEFERLIGIENQLTNTGAAVTITVSLYAIVRINNLPVVHTLYSASLSGTALSNALVFVPGIKGTNSAATIIDVPELAMPFHQYRLRLQTTGTLPDAGQVRIVENRRW